MKLLMSCIAALLSVPALYGSGVYLPTGAQNSGGNAVFTTSPFNATDGTTRIQQLFSGTGFAAQSGPTTITGLSFAPASTGNGFTFSSVEVELATVSESSLSSTFASNASSESVVFNGSLTLPTVTSVPAPGSAGEFEVSIPFTTAFNYNPNAGNLLVDIIVNETSGGTYLVRADTQATGTLVFSEGPGGAGAAGGTVQDALALTEFTTTPEPATLVLFATALSGLLLLRRLFNTDRSGQSSTGR